MSRLLPVPSPAERRVGIVTADRELARDLERHVRGLGHQVITLTSLAECVARLREIHADVVMLDAALIARDPRALLTTMVYGSDAPSVIAVAHPDAPGLPYDHLEHGVTDVVHRPLHRAELRLRIGRALQAHDLGIHLASLEDEISERSRRSFSDRILVARSPTMRRVSETIDRVAKMRTTALVLGESGVGKELVARALHFRSPRLDGPFIAINCAALPPHLIESELFGHERGAFTGAVNRRAGKFELAHRGTLFLDEVGETDLPTQAKLLRVIESHEFMRVGGTRPVRVDVRLVAATNADLLRLVREGLFREDLYYRLKVVTLEVPPLRERLDDIPELAEAFLAQICRNNQLPPRRLTAEALRGLCSYPWPGNVRELLNTLEALVVSNPGEVIDVEHLPAAVRGIDSAVPVLPVGAWRPLAELQAESVRLALVSAQGSRTHAAALLGIGVRTLRRRIAELGLQHEMPPRRGRPRRRD